MAEVGILSMQRIANYGSFLQAYCLKQMLEELGHGVQFVDYHIGTPLGMSQKEAAAGWRRSVQKAAEVMAYDAPLYQRLEFLRFKKHFSKRYHPILGLTGTPNYTPKLDALVIGSDEVFNCAQRNPNVGYSPELFGKDHRARQLLTYAASFGNTTIQDLQQYHKTQELSGLLKGFQSISVRDAHSGQLVHALTGREASFHLDPVLVYDLIGKCSQIPKIAPKEKYLLLYAYSGRISHQEAYWISDYARKHDLKIYTLGGIQSCGNRFIPCDPFFVPAWFQSAELVLTDTFHGTIFSIITQRPFVTLIRKSRQGSYGNEEKLRDLLMRLNLADRGTTEIEAAKKIWKKPIDFTQTRHIIEQGRKSAYHYLKSQIREPRK